MVENRSLYAIRRLFNDESRPGDRDYEADIPRLFGEDQYLPEVSVTVNEHALNGNLKTYRLTATALSGVIDYTINVVETFFRQISDQVMQIMLAELGDMGAYKISFALTANMVRNRFEEEKEERETEVEAVFRTKAEVILNDM